MRWKKMNYIIIYRLNEPVSTRFIMEGEDIEAKMLDLSKANKQLISLENNIE